MSTALYFIIWRMIFSIGIQNSWRSWNNAGRNEDECVKIKMAHPINQGENSLIL